MSRVETATYLVRQSGERGERPVSDTNLSDHPVVGDLDDERRHPAEVVREAGGGGVRYEARPVQDTVRREGEIRRRRDPGGMNDTTRCVMVCERKKQGWGGMGWGQRWVKGD